MANIEVTELLVDPDFVDPMTVVTRFPVVNGLGETSLREETQNSFGCVEPISGKDVEKIPEALRTSDVRTFWFRGTIEASAPGKYSSIIVFAGKRFQVKAVSDWANFGAGYTSGFCVAEVPS